MCVCVCVPCVYTWLYFHCPHAHTSSLFSSSEPFLGELEDESQVFAESLAAIDSELFQIPQALVVVCLTSSLHASHADLLALMK